MGCCLWGRTKSDMTEATQQQQQQFITRTSQVVLEVKNPPATAGDLRNVGSVPGSGRSSGGEYGNPLQYSCLENSMDRGAWQAI